MANQEEVPNLPRDLLLDILSRLPIKSILRFRCVSKLWLSLIDSSHFINLHLARSDSGPDLLLYYESNDLTKDYYSLRRTDTFAERMRLQFPFSSVYGYVRIVGSSRGLVCLFDTNYFTYVGTVILWNPFIRKIRAVPDSHYAHQVLDTFSHIVVGFGFVPGVEDYKVVQILYDSNSQSMPEVLVYELGVNSWRRVGAIAPCYIPNCWSSNVYVNGAVHWKAYKRPKKGSVFNAIMSFDMADEVFHEMGLPKNLSPDYDQMHLAGSASGTSLSLFFHFQNALGDRWEMWSMKEYGVVESWTRQFIVDQPQVSRPLYFMENGQVLVALYSGKLLSYDPVNRGIKDLQIWGVPTSFCIFAYMSSLVLLDGGNNGSRYEN